MMRSPDGNGTQVVCASSEKEPLRDYCTIAAIIFLEDA